ncbi:MAG: VasL domain-containing protein [Pantoea sp.]|uniref:VasL domain-containing protein n=1 Tax=Pantoea sp. TaxID=69393 RepID=UPI0039E46644
MMSELPPQPIQTGGDPRTFSEYVTLRDEIGKLSHPARPDVDWRHVEKLCLALFELNGVELQSASWYTLARIHTAGVHGLNEGLSILEALIARQWAVLWPQAMSARMDIISTLVRRLQNFLRCCMFQHQDELTGLYRSEALLQSLRDRLTGYGMRDAAQTGALYEQIKSAIAHLKEGAVNMPQPLSEPPTPKVYVIQPTVGASASMLKPFVSGACCALLAGAMVLGSVVWFRYEHMQQQAHMEQQRRVKEAIPFERLQSWQQGMAELQQLTEQLNRLDKTRGKYLTVSELKSSIFSVMQAFNQHPPVEEQLRRYAEDEGNQSGEQVQIEILLRQLEYRYQLLREEKGS